MSELELGDVVDNRYIVERLLGRGGMAAVYLVRHRTLGSFHAIKVLELDRPSVRKRLTREGAVQSRLKHANLVAVTDAIEIDGKAALVMEYVHGPNLAQVLERGRLGLDEVDAVVAGIFDGLEAAHRQNIVHRDLKPHNVMMAVEEYGIVPKVADFGLVKMLDEDGEASQTRTGMVFGTPEYMSPEQIKNAKGVDARADIFSLGVMLYEMVSGERPFGGGDLLETLARISTNDRKPLRELAPDAPERMVAAAERALVPDRENRVQTVADLRALWFQQAPRAAPNWDRAHLLSLVAPLPSASEPGPASSLPRSKVTATRSNTNTDDDSWQQKPAPTAVPVTAQTGMFDPTSKPAANTSETVDLSAYDNPAVTEAARAAAPVTMMADIAPPLAAPHKIPTLAPKPAPALSVSDFELQQRSSPVKWLVPALLGGVLFVALIGVGLVGLSGVLNRPVEPPVAPKPPVVVVSPPKDPVAPIAIVKDPVVVAPIEAPKDPITKPPKGPTAIVKLPKDPIVDVVVPPKDPVVAVVVPPKDPVVTPPVPTGPPPRVRVEGADQMTVVLRDTTTGKSMPPRDAGVGTYEVVAFFEPNTPTIVKTVELGYGTVVTVKCSLAGTRCVVTQ